CTAAPCSDDSRMRRSALPSVWPKPRSSGSATTVANRVASVPGVTCSLFGRISSCQFFWIVTLSPLRVNRPASRFAFKSLALEIAGQSAAVKIPKPIARRRAARDQTSDAPALARTATIVRDRRHVADRRHGEARRLQRTKRRFTARTRTGNFHFQRAHAVFLRLLGNVFGRDLRGIGGRLARALEAHRAGRGPGNRVALRIGDGDGRVVERRIDVRDARGDVLAFATAYAGGFLAHYLKPSCDLKRRRTASGYT